MARKSIKSWAALMTFSFFNAAHDKDPLEPTFNEAAGSGEESGGGVTPVTFGSFLLLNPKDGQTADNTASKVIRHMRQTSATFTKDNLRSVHIK